MKQVTDIDPVYSEPSNLIGHDLCTVLCCLPLLLRLRLLLLQDDSVRWEQKMQLHNEGNWCGLICSSQNQIKPCGAADNCTLITVTAKLDMTYMQAQEQKDVDL